MLTCAKETQQAAGAEEVVVGVEEPLEMVDTEQGDIALETQQDLDSSDEDMADTQDTEPVWEDTKGQGQKQRQVNDKGGAISIGREG